MHYTLMREIYRFLRGQEPKNELLRVMSQTVSMHSVVIGYIALLTDIAQVPAHPQACTIRNFLKVVGTTATIMRMDNPDISKVMSACRRAVSLLSAVMPKIGDIDVDTAWSMFFSSIPQNEAVQIDPEFASGR